MLAEFLDNMVGGDCALSDLSGDILTAMFNPGPSGNVNQYMMQLRLNAERTRVLQMNLTTRAFPGLGRLMVRLTKWTDALSLVSVAVVKVSLSPDKRANIFCPNFCCITNACSTENSRFRKYVHAPMKEVGSCMQQANAAKPYHNMTKFLMTSLVFLIEDQALLTRVHFVLCMHDFLPLLCHKVQCRILNAQMTMHCIRHPLYM